MRWLKRHARRLMALTGMDQWGTKSFEFWTFLSMLLALARPKSIVELGSGRSTSYLSEYALKQRVPYASVEQNRFYVTRIKRGLRYSFLPDRYVHHVPLAADGWYRREALDRVAGFRCEFLFVDGPVGFVESLGKGTRRTDRSMTWLAAAARTARIVMVDDVHRKSNLRMFRELISESPGLRPLYLARPAPFMIAIAVEETVAAALTGICAQIGIECSLSYSDELCTEP